MVTKIRPLGNSLIADSCNWNVTREDFAMHVVTHKREFLGLPLDYGNSKILISGIKIFLAYVDRIILTTEESKDSVNPN